MPWSIVDFGKYRGKGMTLPQIVFDDPDWFFNAIEDDYFKNMRFLNNEAKEIDRKARAIRIPNNNAGNREAEYYVHAPTGKFSHMVVVPKSQPRHEGSSPAIRRDVIDLSVPRQISSYDKLGGKNMLSSVKSVLFGGSARMTKDRCEAFFDNPSNFRL
jgi:hypothetical protein